MSLNLRSATVNPTTKILCYYTNSTSKIQIIRITKTDKLNLEKIIFPRQRILFEATIEGQLEIHTSQAGEKRITQIVPCQNLRAERLELNSVADNLVMQQDKFARA